MITLVFGLAFGFFLVLLVVPSVMAMQADFQRQVTAAKRALRGRRAAMFVPAALAGIAAVGLFAALIAPLLLTGAPWAGAVAVLPMLAAGGFGVAFGIYVVLLFVLLLGIYAFSMIGTGLRRGKA